MVKGVYANYLDLKIVCFCLYGKRVALFGKKVNGNMSILIEKDPQISFMSQYESSNVEIVMYKISGVANNKHLRKNMSFIRIRTKSSSSYIKAIKQFNLHVLSPLINMHQLSRNSSTQYLHKLQKRNVGLKMIVAMIQKQKYVEYMVNHR